MNTEHPAIGDVYEYTGVGGYYEQVVLEILNNLIALSDTEGNLSEWVTRTELEKNYVLKNAEEVWPKSGDTAYRLTSSLDICAVKCWTGSEKQKRLLDAGNMYRTYEEAEQAKERVAKAYKGI